MEHNHSHNHDFNLGNAFKIGISINLIFIVIEVIYGYLSNSSALISDAGHNFSDVISLIFAWIGVILSKRKPTKKFTYGLRRSTIYISLLNTFLLLVAVVYIIFEAVKRFGEPVNINTNNVIIIATIGILVNGFTAWLFVKEKKHDLNIKSTFVHFVADALVSLGVVVSGIIIAITGYVWIDTIVSGIIVVIILYSTFNLFFNSFSLALDAVPQNIDFNDVKNYFTNLDEVSDIHDLHIWALSTTDTALSVHLVLKQQAENNFISEIQHHLHEHFGIEHSTIQVELSSNTECENKCN